MHDEPVSDGVEHDLTEAGHQITRPDIEEVEHSESNEKVADLSLQIPPRPAGFGRSPSGKGLLQSQDSFKRASVRGGFFRGLSFKNKIASIDGEGSSLLDPYLKENRCVSLPVTPASNLSPSVPTPFQEKMADEKESSQGLSVPAKVSRSLSAPMRNIVIVRSLSFASSKEPVETDSTDDNISPVHMEDGDEEIPEEEAVCRICLDGLCEGGNTFKMECSCKGDLVLTHEECVVKWFSIKGNRNCDVCGQEVSNLPVSVLRVQASAQRQRRHGNVTQGLQSMSAWYDLVVLTLISSISYFFILEQLLIQDLKSQAIIIAAPFSFTLGLLGSMFAIVVAHRECTWTYAAIEFALVAFILHICYNILQLQAIYSVLLSAILGFGSAITLNTVFLCLLPRPGQVIQRRTESSSVVQERSAV